MEGVEVFLEEEVEDRPLLPHPHHPALAEVHPLLHLHHLVLEVVRLHLRPLQVRIVLHVLGSGGCRVIKVLPLCQHIYRWSRCPSPSTWNSWSPTPSWRRYDGSCRGQRQKEIQVGCTNAKSELEKGISKIIIFPCTCIKKENE